MRTSLRTSPSTWMRAAVFVASTASAPAAWAQAAISDDPYDGRHVALTVLVNHERAAIEDVAVGPGVAHAQLAGSSRLRVRLLDARGDVLREFGYPDPLSVRVYSRPKETEGKEDQESSSSGASDEPPHTVIEEDEAEVTIVVPLLPALAAVAVGWSDGKDLKAPKDVKGEAVDVRDVIKRGCTDDDHAVCRAWLEAPHEGR